MSGYPTRAQFAEHVGSAFTAATPAGDVTFELDAVREGFESEGYAPFSLEFTAVDEQLPQGTYTLVHEVLGTHAIFIVPVAREGERTRYEAVFNVAKESEG